MKLDHRAITKWIPDINLLSAVFLCGLLLPAGAMAMGGSGGGCPVIYSADLFRACYFAGTDPATGTYLGTESDPDGYLGSPAPDWTFGIDKNWSAESDWSTAGVFGGRLTNISSTWKASINFNGGDYLFTVVSSNGVRLFIDEQEVLNQWSHTDALADGNNFIVRRNVSAGRHNIRVEWSRGTTPSTAFLQLHWDKYKAPELGNPQVSDVNINVYIVKKLQTCFVGKRWDRSYPQLKQLVVLKESGGGGVYKTWQVEGLDAADQPKALKPSDPTVTSYQQWECFTFELRTDPNPALDDIEIVKQNALRFAGWLEEWSFGAIRPIVEFIEIEGEFEMQPYFNEQPGFILYWGTGNIADAIQSSTRPVTRDSDFVFAVSPVRDLVKKVRYKNPVCGHTNFPFFPYSWLAEVTYLGTSGSSCSSRDNVFLHEWEHQMHHALIAVMQINGGALYGINSYPSCGQGDPDTFRWYPHPHDPSPPSFTLPKQDPDSPWCGRAGNYVAAGKAQAAHALVHHFDSTLIHYVTDHLTGNHCDNGRQDGGETDVDFGGDCPD